MGYIYKVTNKINNKIYIGQTIFSLEERWYRHQIKAKLDKTNNKFYNAINKYGIKNFYPEIIEECSEEELDNREKYWITYYDSYNNGYNSTLGGDGKAYLDRQLLINTYNQVQNIKKTAEILNIDAGHLSKVLKENNINVLSSQEVVNKEYGKSVAMLDVNTEEVLKTFISLADAAKYIKEITNSLAELKGMTVHIRQAAQGKRKTAYKYKWKFI